MRFYKNRQAEMLHYVSHFLNENKGKLSLKVPAMKDFIDKFIEMEQFVYSIITGNPNLVKANTLEKISIKHEFAKVVAKLIAVLNASGYEYKNKSLPEMGLSLRQLNKMAAAQLAQTYVKVFAAMKKVRNLQYYGLSDGDIRDMQAYYKEFSAIKNAPAMKKKEMALNNKNLVKGVKDCISFLETNIDQLMLIAAEGDPRLQSEYKALRKVLPRAQGRPSDAETGYRKSRHHRPPLPRD